MSACFEKGLLVEERMNRVLTQYRESPKLLFLLRTYLQKAEDFASEVCNLPEKFDIETAVGDQLTIIGKRLGWPRCHCICETQPFFGFDCEDIDEGYVVSGFCDDNVTWVDCGSIGIGEICLNNDELYRKFLKVRRYQISLLYDIQSLQESVKILWGDEAFILDSGHGRIVIAPGRSLNDSEIAVLQLYPRVLPVALGIEVRFHFNQKKVFGFGEGWGGFCEPWQDSVILSDENKNQLVTESGSKITTGPLTRDAPWMCELDVKPYSC